MNSYVKLSIAALLPVIAAAILYLLDKKIPLRRKNDRVRQVVIGLVFGALAIVGTECGIPFNGAQANCRDAAVLIAGLMFGGPAGIIAGLIGGVERWIAVAWGVGSFTRVACTVSTILAGVYAALLRKYMFENKKPGIFISLAIGVVVEVFHLTMVFLTNMATPQQAMAAVRACALPMITANGASVMLAALLLVLLGRGSTQNTQNQVRISQTIQRWLLLTVAFAFLCTSYFVFRLQDQMAKTQENTLLNLALDETAADIADASDENLLSITHKIRPEVITDDLSEIAEKYGISEISLIDKNGIISRSSVPEYVGFDMHSGAQSSEFLCLLEGTNEFVQKYGPISSDSSISRKYAGVKTESGFLQVGYDAAQFQSEIDKEIVGITKNRHVGETGYILIVNQQYELVSAPRDITHEILAADRDRLIEAEPDTTVTLRMKGEMVCSRYREVEGYFVIAVLPEAEALQMRNIALYVNAFMEILVFAILFVMVYMLIKRVVVNRIKRINQSLGRITSGHLDEVVDVRSNEEFASLSDDINSTVDTLKRYIAEASARIDAELEFAKSIQASALPNVFPAFPKRKDFDIYATMDPAKEVGGDFYDFYMTGGDTLHFLVADVSGKGIPAAMFMMRAKTELKSLTETGLSLSDIFTMSNQALCEGNDAGMFVTAWQGSIDLNTGLVQFANAGHNPPLVRRAGGKFEYLRSRAGFVLAGMEEFKYKTQELQLQPGDMIYLYTDGVTEATNADNELYGEERLLSAINSREFDSMDELCHFIRGELDAFVGEAPQFDDITMVAFRYIGTPPAPRVHFDRASINDIPAVTEFIESELERLECPMRSVVQVNVAIDELYSNIVKYAYPEEPGPVTVALIAKDDPKCVYIRFEDEGIPYNPLTKEDPDITLSADERTIGGLGIFVVKKTMDGMRYKYENGRNILTIKKLL